MKTVPAQLMGAASAGKPAIMLTAGPRGCGQFQGRSIVTSDVWTLVPDRLEGRISDAEWDELEGVFAPTVGVCNVMGTATTMAIAAEVLGMALPGSAAVPAVESRRRDLAERTGVRAVELARAGTRPEDVMTPRAFDNAIRVLSATGGSTNEFIHLVAIAVRLAIRLGLDRFAAIGEQTPQVLGVRPSGPFSLEDFDHAGGVPALLAVLEPLLESGCVVGDGRTVAEVCAAVRAATPRPHPCLRSLDDPFEPKSGLVVLRGSLAPRGAIFKRSAAPRKLWTHRGPAVVFDYHTAHERADDPGLYATPDSVIVLRNAGPVGAPGMPEIDFVPIPAVLRKAGITEVVCVTDGRMSGTEGGATALHVTPEAAAGGPSDSSTTAMRSSSTPRPAHSICSSTTTSSPAEPPKPRPTPPQPAAATSGSTSSTSCNPTRAATWTSWSITANTNSLANFDFLLAGAPTLAPQNFK